MKKLFLMAVSVYCISHASRLQADEIYLSAINRALLGGVAQSLRKISNIGSSFVAMCAHNYLVNKKSSNFFDVKNPHLLACLAGGWSGDALNNAISKRDLPLWIRVPLQHSFATSWLVYNVIVNRTSALYDPSNLAVGGYLLFNWVDRYRHSGEWPYDDVEITVRNK